MTIKDALKKLKKKKYITISSKQAEMFKQNRKSSLFWLLEDDFSIIHKQATLKKIIEATDWKVDNDR